MAVVIRLQGLRVTAGTQDIRKFFTGLKIPDGGVHIIGGDREEAFIIFASDEDARRAMTRSGGVIKGGNITLLLSSKSEMQSMLEKSTKTLELDQQRQLEEDARRTHRSVEAEVNRRAGNRLDHTPAPRHQWASHPNDELLVFLKGLPFSVTEKEIQEFFDGLLVDDMVLLRNERGQNNGTGLVKFSTSKDAKAGLERDRNYIGSRYVEVYTTTQDNWRRLAGRPPHGANTDGVLERGGSPFRGQRNFQHQVRPRAPLSQRPTPSLGEEFCILLENLSFAVEKEDIRKFFRSASLEDDQILLLRGDFAKRTRSAFVLFKTMRDYRDATVTEKRSFFNRWIYIRPVSREKMISILDSEDADAHTSGNSGNLQERPPSHPRDNFESEKVCLFVQNLPFDVRKVEIMDFFFGFNITEENVFLLRNNAGAGIGKALVLFRSESAAMSALSLSGQRFLGSEVALKCISRAQMQEMGVEPPMMEQPHLRENRFPGRGNEAGCEGNMPMTNMQSRFHGGRDQGSYTGNQYDSQDRGNGIRGSYGPSGQPFEGPTCIKLVNLPFQIKSEEIYDFCYGYRIIPGSVSLQYDKSGASQGSATVVFESRQEALTAVEELSGRPIGPRKVQLLFV